MRLELVSHKVAISRSGFWIVFVMTLPLLVHEVVEYWSDPFTLDPDFAYEVLGLLVLPPAVGLGLGWLKRHESGLARILALFHRKTSPVNTQQVLVVEDNLFGELVKGLLSRVKDLKIVGFAPRDGAELVKEIKRTRPAVVVVDAAMNLINPDSLVGLLNESQALRVVAMSADDNTVLVYDKQQVSITRGEDLASIIRGWFQA